MPTMTCELKTLFNGYLTNPGWSAYSLVEAIERSGAPMDQVHQALAPIGGLNACDSNGLTPLMVACLRGFDQKFVARLLEHADPHRARIIKNWYSTPMGDAAQHGHWNLVKLLEEHGVDPAEPCLGDLNVLHHATQVGALDVVQRLLNQGLHPLNGPHGVGALDLALRALPSSKPTVDAVTREIREAITLALLSASPDLSHRRWPSRWPSSQNWPWADALDASPSVLRAMVAHGVPIDARSQDERSVLTERLRTNVLLMVPSHRSWPAERDALTTLIDLGADVNARDTYGFSPLYYAMQVSNLNVELLTLLINAGASLDDPVVRWQPRTLRENLLHVVGSQESVQGVIERHDLLKMAHATMTEQGTVAPRTRARL